MCQFSEALLCAVLSISPNVNPWDAGTLTLESLRAEQLAQRTQQEKVELDVNPGSLVPTAPVVQRGGGRCFGLMSAGQGLLQDLHAPRPQSHLQATKDEV